MIAEIESTLNPVAEPPGQTSQATVVTELSPGPIGVKQGKRNDGSETISGQAAGFREQFPAVLIPRAGGATETERGFIGSAPGEDRCSALNFAQAAGMRPVSPTADDGRDVHNYEGVVSEESSGAVKAPLLLLGDGKLHGTNGACADSVPEWPLPERPTPQVLSDAGVGEPPDEWRINEANRRQSILEEFQLLLERGHEGRVPMSKKQAAAAVGQGHVTIYRWQKKFAKSGFNGLLPETEKCGRKTIWEKLGFTKEQFDAIMVKVRGLNLDLKSVTASLRAYAQSDDCPPDLARVILDPNRCSKHALPPSLRKAVQIGSGIFGRDAKNHPLHLAHRGPRALSLKGAWTPRKLDILPGDIFSSDDTTPIWGYYVPWREDSGSRAEYPFGVKMMQGQLLPMLDVGGQAIINYALIARESSSYRASDIWSLFAHTFATVGLPRLGFQLERGSWEANIIRGQEVQYRDREVTMSRRVGGLRQMPTNITSWHKDKIAGAAFPKTLQTWTSFLPKSKSIEAFFQRCQTFEGTIWGCLGRDQMRAPFEKTKKIYEACRRGAADPRLHFLSQEELVKRLNDIIGYVNREPMEGEIFKGIPIQNFEQAVKEYPLFHVEPEMQWLYRRDWSVTQVTGYFVRVRLTHPMSGERYSLFYENPEVFARHSGEEVAVYYDRENFEQPAQIILARTGEFLCEAQYEDRKGSFLGGDQSGHDMRKRWKNAVMTVYSTLVKHAPSRQVPVEIAARREEAKAAKGVERQSVPGMERPEVSRTSTVTVDTVTVDGRPAGEEVSGRRSVGVSAGPSKERIEQQRNDFSQQAAIAAQLRALRGEE